MLNNEGFVATVTISKPRSYNSADKAGSYLQ